MFNNIIILNYSDVYDSPPEKLITYLSGISRSKALMIGAYFLSIPPEKAVSYQILEKFYSDNKDFVAKINHKCAEISSRSGKSVTITYIISSLRLVEFINDNLDEKDTQSDKEAEINILKAYLAINEAITKKQAGVKATVLKFPKEIHLWALTLTNGIADSDITRFNSLHGFITQIIKSVLLFRFLKDNKDPNFKGSELLELYFEKYEIESHNEFLYRYIPLLYPDYLIAPEGFFDITIPFDKNSDKSTSFLDKFILQSKINIEELDFKTIRQFPLQKVEEGKYRLLFKNFVIEKMYQTQYFDLNQIYHEKINSKFDFRRHYTLKFSEQYLLDKFIREIFIDAEMLLGDAQLRGDGTPDFYVRNKESILLFECKDRLFRADIRHTYDFEQLHEELKKKIYEAIPQLLRNVSALLRNKNHFEDISTGVNGIYPIIVIHHNVYDAPGLNHLVNYWFEQDLHNLSRTQDLDKARVNPVIVINIDDIILFSDLFKDGRLNFIEILNDYIAYVKLYKTSLELPQNIREQLLTQTFIPFSYFLFNKVREKGISYGYPKLFMELMKDIFPDS